MEIPQTAVYALRAMSWLAVASDGVAMTSRELSDATGIPPHYLSKVLRRLVSTGLLDARKGHGGGFSLARIPAEIRLVEILAAVDYGGEPDRCAFGWGLCNPSDPCPLHPVWSKLNDAFHGWASNTTLAEVEYDLERGAVKRGA